MPIQWEFEPKSFELSIPSFGQVDTQKVYQIGLYNITIREKKEESCPGTVRTKYQIFKLDLDSPHHFHPDYYLGSDLGRLIPFWRKPHSVTKLHLQGKDKENWVKNISQLIFEEALSVLKLTGYLRMMQACKSISFVGWIIRLQLNQRAAKMTLVRIKDQSSVARVGSLDWKSNTVTWRSEGSSEASLVAHKEMKDLT